MTTPRLPTDLDTEPGADSDTRTGSVPVEGGQLWYETAGTGPVVVLAHPGITDARIWDELFEPLASEHTVIRFDARGHGRSTSIAGDFRPHDDLATLLTRLGVAPAVIVGNSLGARNAVDLALERPDLVTGLVLIGPGLSGYEFADPFTLRWQCEVAAAARTAMQTSDPAPLVETILRGELDGPHRTADQVDPALRRRLAEIVTTTVMTHYTNHGKMLEVGARDRLQELSMPVLAIAGTVDLQDCLDVVDLIADRVPNARRLLVEGVGHLVQNERPEWLLARLQEFLLAVQGRGADGHPNSHPRPN
jgi:3-oxoadipate enol-lactonase